MSNYSDIHGFIKKVKNDAYMCSMCAKKVKYVSGYGICRKCTGEY